jgi:hypothetical protein
MRPRILLALALIVPAVLACESALLPQPEPEASGTFVLDVSDGPVVLRWASVRATLLADTLRFKSDGTAVRSGRTHYDYDTFRDTTLSTSSPYRHHTEGFRLELELVCPLNALCSPPPHLWGTVTGESLVLHAAEDPRPTLRYRRISEEVGPYSR